MEDLKLYKAYLNYSERTILQMYWAKNADHVYELMEWTIEDRPQPIIIETKIKVGCFLCHHISDKPNFYKEIK